MLRRALPFLGLSLAACASTGAAGSGAGASAASEQRAPAIDPRIGLVADPRITQALDEISASRIRATDSALVSFGTRHMMSDTVSRTRGIGAARRWIHAQLADVSAECGGCLRVEYDTASVVVERHPQKPTVRVTNVLAWLPGRDPRRVVVIGGHYDSCICSIDRWDSTSDAPGADDDGSGTAAVMELARAFAKRFPQGLDATVVFALYDGEELGLLGSTALARRMHASGMQVTAAFADDMVGNVSADDGSVDSTTVRVFAADPDTGPSRELGRYVWGLSAIYTPTFRVLPVWRLDRIGRGGDHSPFVRLGDPGLRFSEKLENYKRQHRPNDLLDDVNFGYVANVARLNLAAVASLASAPPAPDSVRVRRDAESGGQKFTVTWKPVAGAAGYELLVRRTFAPTHERIVPVGNVTRWLLDEQLDDATVAVRAVGAGGHRSLATAFGTGAGG